MEAAYFGVLDMADPKRILVVEDDDSTREALSQILEMEGYETCGSPEWALSGHSLYAQKRRPGPIDLTISTSWLR
jgi:DNA-binding NtrC family response regulator